jgi:hydrogenase expression/formation protein HypE
MHRLLEAVFRRFGSVHPHDGAVLETTGRLAFTTDSYVVRPLFFPGGDIGSLAVYGTVNDLAMCGARPRALSCGFILEEGLPLSTLERVLESMARAAAACGVPIVTGDTKVVERGHGDGLFINTAGVGEVLALGPIGASAIRPGDAVLVSGDLGRHGIAILAAREGLAFETTIESDSGPLLEPVMALLQAGFEVHCLRDLTRGGLTSALVELSEASGLGIELEESALRTHDEVQGACELLGLDPLAVANEGRMVVFLPAAQAGPALELLARFEPTAFRAGTVQGDRVVVRTALGSRRVLDMPSGEQLPRIC